MPILILKPNSCMDRNLYFGASISVMVRQLTGIRLFVPRPWKASLVRRRAVVLAKHDSAQPTMIRMQVMMKVGFRPLHCMKIGTSITGIPARPYIDPEIEYEFGASV